MGSWFYHLRRLPELFRWHMVFTGLCGPERGICRPRSLEKATLTEPVALAVALSGTGVGLWAS